MRQLLLNKKLAMALVATLLVLSGGFVNTGLGASTTVGSHGPIMIRSDSDFTPVSAAGGCKCVTAGTGTSANPFVIGPWTIMATSNVPGILIDGTTIKANFTLLHITVHGTSGNDGIDLVNVNGLGPHGEHFDSIQAANIDGAANGISLTNVAGVTITGNSVNNNFLWGVRLENSRNNTVTFMTVARNGLSTPDTKAGNPESIPVFLGQHFGGGVLFLNSNHNVLSVSQLSEDAYAGFVLVRSDFNIITDVHSRYPDYYGGLLQDSSHNTISKISMQTADFVGLVVRGGGFNTIENSTFSANGPIGNEEFGLIVPYYISGLYLGWGTHDNKVTLNHSNNGNTGPGLLVDNGTIRNPIQSPAQTANPFNNPAGNDLGHVPSTTLGDKSNSAFDAGMPTIAGSNNVYCGNTFTNPTAPVNPNAPCPH